MKRFLLSIVLAVTIISAFSQQLITIEQCKELALKNNEKIKNAAIAVEISKEQKKEAFTKFFPNVSAVGLAFTADKNMISMDVDVGNMVQPMISNVSSLLEGLGFAYSIPPLNIAPIELGMLKNGIMGGIMATQPIFAGGQIVNGNRLATIGIEARELQNQMSENEVLLTVEQYFWSYFMLREKLKIIDNSDTLLNNILSDVTVFVENGLTTHNDILRVELEQNKLEGNRSKVQNGLQILKLMIAQTIGISADEFEIQHPEYGNISPLLITHIDSSLLINRIEYKLLDKNVEIANLQLKMEIGKNMPTLAVGAGYNYMNFDLQSDYGMKNDFGMLFATVSVPLSNWWGGSYSIKQKKLELKVAENTISENAKLLSVQMQQTVNELNQAYHQVMLERRSISSAQENLKISRDNYNAGIITLSDLLESQNLLQQATDQYSEAITQYYIKSAKWNTMNKTK